MIEELAAAAAATGAQGLRWGVVAAVFLAGLRHGFDIDHIAAITDIASSQTNRARSFMLATMYALGHALVLIALGVVAVVAGVRIPASVDEAVGRVIGVTLVVLGAYVVYTLVRFRHAARVRSRWMLVLAGLRRSLMWLRRHRVEPVEIEHVHPHDETGHHEHGHDDGVASPTSSGPARAPLAVRTAAHTHPHRHTVTMPADPFEDYGVATSFGIGLIHGVGAETPTQILLFTTAAGLAGSIGGVVVVAAFVGGLFVGNTILAVAATAGLIGGRKASRLYTALAGTTAFVSILVGSLYAVGRADLLPWFLGG